MRKSSVGFLLFCLFVPVSFANGQVGPPPDLPGDEVAINEDISEMAVIAAETGQFQWVTLPAGTFRIKGPIVLKKKVGLRGAGIGLTRIEAQHSGLSFTIYDASHARLRGLNFTGSSTQVRMGDMINSPRVRIEQTRIGDLHEPTGNTQGLFGLRIQEGCDHLKILDCVFEEMSMVCDYEADPAALRGITFTDGRDHFAGPQNVVIRRNRFESIFAVGAYSTPRDADAIFVNFTGSAADILIMENEFINCGKRAIKDKTGGLEIRDNVFRFDDSFYSETLGVGSVVYPSSAISLQGMYSPTVNSIVVGNDISGNFVNAAITVGVDAAIEPPVLRAVIRNNDVTAPLIDPANPFDINDPTDVRDWSNRDGIDIQEAAANTVIIDDNRFHGYYRWGINRDGLHNTVILSNTTFSTPPDRGVLRLDDP